MASVSGRIFRSLLLLSLVAFATPLFAQQTGSITGKVTTADGSLLPGVSVEARSDVLPGPRATVTGANGEYRLRALPPGTYTVKFDLSGMQSVTRKAQVQLAQDVVADATLGPGMSENVTVTAESSIIDKDSASIASALSSDQIQGLPLAQEYRDLQRLIPAVQYTQDETRGPSAGGSGQDNVYRFDGVDVTTPQYGTLSAEPASHDIAQVTVTTGGATRGGLQPRRWLFDRLGEQVRNEPVPRRAQLPVPGQGHDRGPHERRPVALRPRPRLAEREPRGADPEGAALLLRLLLPADGDEVERRQPLRRAPRLRQHPQRGLRQADLHAHEVRPAERQLPRVQARRDRGAVRRERLPDLGHRLRVPPEDLHG